MSWVAVQRLSLAVVVLIGCMMPAGCDEGSSTPSASERPASSEGSVQLAALSPQTPLTAPRPSQLPQPAPSPSPSNRPDSQSPAVPAVKPKAVEEPPAPVVFDPPVLDLGVLRPNQRTTGQVMIRNVGDKPVTIRETRASCTCTSVNLRNVVIEPGKEVALPASFNGQSIVGEKRASVRVLIDGYAIADLPVHVRITSPIVVEPSAIDAQSASMGEFSVTSVEGKPFSVLAVNGEAPDYVDFVPGRDEPRAKYRIRWDLSSFDSETCRNGIGQLMPGWFLVETDHPDVPVMDMEVRHKCNTRIKAGVPAIGQSWLISQKSAMIGQVKAGQSTEFIVGVTRLPRAVGNDPVVSVRSESPDIDVELLGLHQQSDMVELQVRVTPKGDHRGALYAPIRFFSAKYDCPLVVLGKVVD
jgi:hypothetical protein